MLTSQSRNKLLIRVGLSPAQLVVEMDHGNDDAKFALQFKQQTQKRYRINPARNRNSNAVAGAQQFLPPDMGQHALGQ
jgi:hypothetical protein